MVVTLERVHPPSHSVLYRVIEGELNWCDRPGAFAVVTLCVTLNEDESKLYGTP